MKMLNVMLLVGMIFFTGVVLSQQEKGPAIEFEKEVHDYGFIEHGANGEYKFKFTNVGNAPLILSNAKGSCSCTVPSWPKEPIAPGGTAELTVKYNTRNSGPINKSVTITSNAINAPTKVIRIKGNVRAKQESGTPINNTGPTK